MRLRVGLVPVAGGVRPAADAPQPGQKDATRHGDLREGAPRLQTRAVGKTNLQNFPRISFPVLFFFLFWVFVSTNQAEKVFFCWGPNSSLGKGG